ncbi:unnamed protein product [Adineta ricciae]|uniref:Plectin/eS10 N-terminal domain-containing protein n=1 Tax=Adineta ricciae TaxID=249248 RepID=A0A813S2M8_ADIRI|nr:unnamed protein product [Adineta ricciae]
MLMPKKHRTLIYEYLMKEGVVVAEKDFGLDKHPAIAVPNIHVIKALQSLKSRNLVKEQFAWRHYYWYLNNEATLKRPTRPEGAKTAKRVETARPSSPSGDQSRQEYRRSGYDKQGEVGAGTARPEFRGGYGRGRLPDGNRGGADQQ